MSTIEATYRAYEIVSKLITGFLAETAHFERENDRDVLKLVRELGVHCEAYSRTLKGVTEKKGGGIMKTIEQVYNEVIGKKQFAHDILEKIDGFGLENTEVEKARIEGKLEALTEIANFIKYLI